MTEEIKQPAPRPTWRQKFGGALRSVAPTPLQLGIAVIVLGISNVATMAYVARSDAPSIMTVGVREMTQGYMAELALSEISPEEAGIRTEMFLAVTQDTLKRTAENGNILLLARECVLGGEMADVTEEVRAAVEAAISRTSGGRSVPSVETSAPAASTAPGVSVVE